jgi:hypothetical protein
MIDDWIKTKVLFWSLNVWIINLNFSKAFSVSEYLISSTNRELKIRIFVDTFFLLTDKKISFSSKSTIFFCLNAMNDESILIESIIASKTKLTIDAKYFLDRSRSRLIDSMNDDVDSSIMSIIEWAKFELVRSRLVCVNDENSRLDDWFNWSTSNNNEFWSWL